MAVMAKRPLPPGPAHLLAFTFLLVFAAFVLPVRGEDSGYVGAAACVQCHAEISHGWERSLHGKMMRPAATNSVEGNFAQSRIVLRGSTYLLQQKNGKYFITEADLTGRPQKHRVEYVLGRQRVQHYLTKLEDGRIIVLPPTWDNVGKKWIHDVDLGNPEEDFGAEIQTWNKTCYSCHVSREKKNFDIEQLRYATTWQDFGVNCERCHGPGREHVAVARAKITRSGSLAAAEKTAIDKSIVNPGQLDPARNTMICAQCHSLRDIYVDDFKPGSNYYNFFLPVMEYRLPGSDDPAYWPDGRPRWLSNEAVALWQSQCFLKGGATCVTCHSQAHDVDVDHNPQLRPENDRLCLGCHKTIAARVVAHTHHAENSAGSSCVECHMPRTVVGIAAAFHDHSMSIPVPENTLRHGIPNACNLCHRDKDAAWARLQMSAWYGEQSRQEMVERADAFSGARKGDASVIPALLRILSDGSGGPFVRANAAGYLAGFPNDPEAYNAVFHSFSDGEPLVRATAAFGLRPRAAQREEAAPQLVSLLQDPVATVRMSAAIALVAMGVRQLPGEDGERFEQAKEMYHARAELNSDDAQQQFAAGRFYLLAGEMDRAVNAFRDTLKLNPKIPAQYALGEALAQKGDQREAQQVLQEIPRSDPQYSQAQRFLANLEATDRGTGNTAKAAPPGSDARALFLDGQLQYQNENYNEALKQLEQALRGAPDAEWSTKAQIDRAICLEKLGRTQEAEAAMKELSDNPAARSDVDLQLSYAELLSDTGRANDALTRIDSAIAAAPQAPMAHFWRAKVLLQLHRIDEAATAAEQAERLMPDLPFAHNLLVKIYELQGRTKEAAQEAQWLRDYQRRTESR
jgi:predicted CXXCH cytochrome family protein